MASVGGQSGDAISLNIMPMLDVFSILILFLLMNFASDPVTHDLSPGMELPESAVLEALDEIPTVIISQNEIMANDKKLVSLLNGKVPENQKSQGGITVLFKELEKMGAANRRLAKDASKADIITLEVDKRQKFDVIKTVMLSAQQAEFIKFKLMVSKQI